MIRAPRTPSSLEPDLSLTLHRTVLLHAVEPRRQPGLWHPRLSEVTAIAICTALLGLVLARLLLG